MWKNLFCSFGCFFVQSFSPLQLWPHQNDSFKHPGSRVWIHTYSKSRGTSEDRNEICQRLWAPSNLITWMSFLVDDFLKDENQDPKSWIYRCNLQVFFLLTWASNSDWTRTTSICRGVCCQTSGQGIDSAAGGLLGNPDTKSKWPTKMESSHQRVLFK